MTALAARPGGAIGGLAARIIGALIMLALGYVVVVAAVAPVIVQRDVASAYALAPGNAQIAAEWARQVLNDDLSPTGQAAAETAARAALRRDPTRVAAVATLGLIAQLRGDAPAARRWFVRAERLSRRDLATQLWWIEDAVGRGAVAEALRHYDTALRTQPGADQVLFPLLAKASGDPNIVDPLVALLRRKPAWGGAFVDYVGANSGDAYASTRFFAALTRAGVEVPFTARNQLVNALLDKDPDVAWAYYASYHPGVDRRRSRDPDFRVITDWPARFDWWINNNTAFSSAIQLGRDHGVFSFSATPTVGGPILQQVQLLPPGVYLLEGRSAGVDQAPGERPYWALKCVVDERELGRIEMPNSAVAGGRFQGQFVVPQGCPAQLLTFVIRPSSSVGGVVGELSRVALGPR